MTRSGDRGGDDPGMRETIPPEALLDGYPADLRRVAERLREIVRDALPQAIEGVRSGWGLIGYDLPLRKGRRFILWIWAQPEHVHLGFQRGNLIADPDGRLQGRGVTKLARWLTFEAGDPIDAAAIAPLIHDCARVAGLSRAEQALLAGEREAEHEADRETGARPG
jgi:hypothetical protein